MKNSLETEIELQILRNRIEKLERVLKIYRMQFSGAMKAQSLGFCKAIMKHAMTDDKKILGEQS